MRRCPPAVLFLLLAACGGGGTAGTTSPATSPVRLAASPVEIGSGASGADLVVELAGSPAPGPSLLQVAVELPPALALASANRLQAAAPLPSLDGDFVDGRFVVLCGDAQNVDASPLPTGPLFRLRLVPSTPRQPGTWTVRLHELRAASREGQTPLPVDANPVVVQVVVR